MNPYLLAALSMASCGGCAWYVMRVLGRKARAGTVEFTPTMTRRCASYWVLLCLWHRGHRWVRRELAFTDGRRRFAAWRAERR